MEAKLKTFLTQVFDEAYTGLDESSDKQLLDATNAVVHSNRWNK